MITLITYGLGMFLGSWQSGAVVDRYAATSVTGMVSHDWYAIWLFSAATAGVVLTLFLFAFNEQELIHSEVAPRQSALETPIV